MTQLKLRACMAYVLNDKVRSWHAIKPGAEGGGCKDKDPGRGWSHIL